MADEKTPTPEPKTADDLTSVAAESAQERPDFFKRVTTLLQRPKKTGAHCEYCDWSGPSSDVLKSPRLNEDGTTYQINTCPQCMRNGGLVFFD